MDVITKSTQVSGIELAAEDLKEINKFTLRELSSDEVFAFKVTLCDNQVDRDQERFTLTGLHKLAKLFKGRTGIFDHVPRAGNQTARIYQTEVLEQAGNGINGEPLTKLVARAYMLRDESTMSVVRSIEAGILKEVSIGCAVEKVVCSICGGNMRASTCQHKKGQTYDGQICHHRLENPTDAYEWSFVAVPAQPGAGVTKGRALQRGGDAGKVEEAVRALRQAIQMLETLISNEEQEKSGEKAAEPEPGDDTQEIEELINDVNKLLKGANQDE